MNKAKLLIIPAVLLLAGCASDSKRVVDLNLHYMTADSAPLNATNSNSQSQLAEASTSVSHSLQQLSQIDSATHPQARLGRPANPKAIGMAKYASINWNGPVEPVVRKIAGSSGYHVRVLGSRPSVPVMVSVDARNQTLASILRNVKYQVVKQASIVTYPSSRTIELRYK